MSKCNCQSVWYNVDNVIQIIESIIDFHSYATESCDMKYCSGEDDACSHFFVDCIKNLLQIEKSFGVGYVFK